MKLKHSQLIFIAILLFAFLTRIYRLHVPERYIFDEVYHVITAKLMAANDPRAFEWWHGPIEPNTAIDWLHPPLAKYTQAFFIRLLGDNSFAWRLSSALFGVGIIWLVYQLAQKLFCNQKISLLAAFLASLDGLLLTQSRIAMNDIHVTFFIILTLLWYFSYRLDPRDKRLILVGLGAGLSISSKWSGLFVLIAVCLLESARIIKALIGKKIDWEELIQQGLLRVLILGLLPFVIYILSYSQMFLQGKGWDHLRQMHQQTWYYQTHLEATHPYQSQPWQWFLNLKPVWFHVDYVSQDTIANTYAIGNSILFWTGAVTIIWSVLFIVFKKLSKGNQIKQLKYLNWLIIAYFMVWLPWQLSPRIMFFYHYTPAVPLMSIVLAFWLIKLWSTELGQKLRWNKIIALLVILAILTNFIIWYPQWTAIPVPKKFAQNIYYLIPSWK
ncbi:phospholipid carrier-dependent glycosyltransferase [Patescibacteria group bacterium]|nr:phospholipid carrier-dependent glycosyltransferase [Patescibacteria group bacterium]